MSRVYVHEKARLTVHRLAENDSYPELLQELKGRLRAAQVQAAFAVNRELVLLYWSIGRELSERFASEGWGGKIVDRLAHDLQTEFPGIEGFSRRNLRYMRSFAEAWPDQLILQQAAAKLPWGHHTVLLRSRKTGRDPGVVPPRRPRAWLEP